MVSVQANFAVVNDMLREAARLRLADKGPIVVEGIGRIGPLVELTFAAIHYESQYREVSVRSRFAANLRSALRSREPFGGGYNDTYGAYPLGIQNPITATVSAWDQWTVHAENIAKIKGVDPSLIASLLGAMIELQDNVYEHSGAPQTGLVAYAVTPASFEFVVADLGWGVLETLRQNPQYSGLTDAGAALQEALKDGVSRFPTEEGRGRGFNQLFRALVGHNAELRFRSSDHSLTMRPTKNAGFGTTALAQVAPLDGLAVSVYCRTGGS
jgi:anti-sigma regulatory factor (Ser/Thr protein kinase)